MKKEQKELSVLVDRVRERTPLIHNITNYVTVNDCANILLACGGSPIMQMCIRDSQGAIYLKEGCIVAMRHIHMSPRDAQAAGVKDGDYVSVKADNERGTVFDHVKIRVDDSLSLIHIQRKRKKSVQTTKTTVEKLDKTNKNHIRNVDMCCIWDYNEQEKQSEFYHSEYA